MCHALSICLRSKIRTSFSDVSETKVWPESVALSYTQRLLCAIVRSSTGGKGKW